MVLSNLGNQLKAAFHNLSVSTCVNDELIQSTIRSIEHALLEADVNVHLVKKLSVDITTALKTMPPNRNKRQFIESVVIKQLYDLLKSHKQAYIPLKKNTNVIMFVGLEGAGKTTTCKKYAAHYQDKGFRVAMICADTFRAGAFDQLKQNCVEIGVPYYGSYSESDPAVVVQYGLEVFKKDNFNLIIIDTSGRHKQCAELFEEMQELHKVAQPDDVVFVMDGMQGQSLKEQAEAFKSFVDVGSVIVTKMDGTARGGGAISAVSVMQCPIAFLGMGEHAKDLIPFEAEAFLKRLLGFGDIPGILDVMGSESMLKSTSETQLLKKLTTGKGDFSFSDMVEQMGLMQKFGMGKMLELMPDMSTTMAKNNKQNKNKPDGTDSLLDETAKPKQADIESKFKQYMVIIDSMTTAEKEGNIATLFQDKNGASRKQRIARGSGTTVETLDLMISTMKPMQAVFSNFKGIFSGLTQSSSKLQPPASAAISAGPGSKPKKKSGRGAAATNNNTQLSLPAGTNLGDMMKSMMGQMGSGGMAGMMSQLMGSQSSGAPSREAADSKSTAASSGLAGMGGLGNIFSQLMPMMSGGSGGLGAMAKNPMMNQLMKGLNQGGAAAPRAKMNGSKAERKTKKP